MAPNLLNHLVWTLNNFSAAVILFLKNYLETHSYGSK